MTAFIIIEFKFTRYYLLTVKKEIAEFILTI